MGFEVIRLVPSSLREDICVIAKRILDDKSGPIVRYRLLRDVLQREPRSAELRAARLQLLSSCPVQSLAAEQRCDGSWGRLHSKDRRQSRRFGTTEAAVEAALAFGLKADDRVLRKAAAYLRSVLKNRALVSDPPERNDRWPTGVELFAGATLACIRPDDRALDGVLKRWGEIVCRAFCSGKFDAQAEADAHREVHRVRDGVGYLTLSTRYAAQLLGARPSMLPQRVRDSYALWLTNQPRGLGYLNTACWPAPRSRSGSALGRWFSTLQLLISFDACYPTLCRCIDWLWDQRGKDGLWDFGPAATGLRFSFARQTQACRSHEHSLHALILAKRLIASPIHARSHSEHGR